MSALKNIAIAGASGALGSEIFKKLNAAGRFKVRVLRRNGSSTTFPAGTEVIDVDTTSLDSIVAALQGQDAFISALGSLDITGQLLLIDAAAAAGVKRFIPSEFGSNLDLPQNRALPVFGHKVQSQDYLIEKSKATDITYTLVYNSAFLDWGITTGFLLNLSERRPRILDGGDTQFSTTTLSSAADAVVGILTHPEETKNRAVRIQDRTISQNDLLALAKKVAPNDNWEITHAKLDDLTAVADARLANQLYDMETFVPYLYRSIFDPKHGSKFENLDNDLLGVKGKTDEDVIQLLKTVLVK